MRHRAGTTRFRLPIADRRRLLIALPARTRIAQVTNPAALFENARYFTQAQTADLEEYSPQILLASSEALLHLARSIEQRRLNLSEVNRAVFVLTGCHDSPLRDTARVILWQTFGVPVYELFLGDNGVLLATECEAYEGLHIEDGVTFSSAHGQLWYSARRGRSRGTGLTGDVESQPCPCGRGGKRIVNVAMDFHDPVRHHLFASM